MNESLKIVLGLIILLPAVVTFLYIMKKKPPTRKQKIYNIAKANNWVTIANVLKYDYFTSEKNGNRRDSWAVTYEYIINGIKHKKRLSFDATNNKSFPNEFKVYYLESNPRKVVFEFDIDYNITYRHGCFWSVLVFIVSGILVATVANLFHIL